MSKPEWLDDLDSDAIEREASVDIKERLALPKIGEAIEAIFLSEPRKIPSNLTGLGWDMFVADVDDNAGITKQLICPRSLRQHLAALLEKGELTAVVGSKVVIRAQCIPEFVTRDGKLVKDAKVYQVSVAS